MTLKEWYKLYKKVKAYETLTDTNMFIDFTGLLSRKLPRVYKNDILLEKNEITDDTIEEYHKREVRAITGRPKGSFKLTIDSIPDEIKKLRLDLDELKFQKKKYLSTDKEYKVLNIAINRQTARISGLKKRLKTKLL